METYYIDRRTGNAHKVMNKRRVFFFKNSSEININSFAK